MKVPPLNLTPDMNRVGMALPFSPDLLWRYPLQMPPSATPSSPLMDVKNQMPANLAVDPRHWSREDVAAFLRWFEREFELPTIDLSKFCMNGKALCMLNKSDLADRAPGAGDILHNTLQFLLRDAPPQMPQSPLTPHHPLLSPSPLTAGHQTSPWPMMNPDLHNFSHILHNGGSVTLSPAPSEQSGGSPRHPDSASITSNTHHSSGASTGSGHSGSHSDSEDSTRDSSSPQRSPLPPHSAMSAFPAHALASLKHLSDYQRAAAAAAAAAAVSRTQLQESNQTHQRESQQQPQLHTQHHTQQHTQPQHHTQPQQTQQQSEQPREEPVETGTNGRLLWDFLQQLLNDSQERYNRYIAWKNRSTGVFKIVDPPGLARLWGIQKNHLSMNYDKMSRALRYYYRVNILRKVQGERHCYQFLRNPSELKSIKNISMLRTQPLQTSPRTKEAPVAPVAAMEEEGPTDLSMPSVHHSQYQHHSSQIDSQPQSMPVNIKNEEYLKAIETQAKNMSVNIKNEDYHEHSYQ